MAAFLSDCRFAFRVFWRNKAMYALSLISLAFGIGASVAMFSIVDSVLLRPLDFPDPQELVAIYPTNPSLRNNPTLSGLAERGLFSLAEFWDLRAQQRAFVDIGMYVASVGKVVSQGVAQQIPIGRASPSLFAVLGVRPVLGKLFDEGEDGARNRTIMLSYRYWRSEFGGSSRVIGRVVYVDNQSWTVIGVLPASIDAVTIDADVWEPRSNHPEDEQRRGQHSLGGAIGRLKPGVTMAAAQNDAARALSLQRVVPGDERPGANVFGLRYDRTHSSRAALLLLSAAAGLLLIVSCGNVAAILLGIGLSRTSELATRGALGASRVRIVQQLLTESLSLALLGGLGGVALAAVGIRVLRWIAPLGTPRIGESALDVRALLTAVLLAALSAVCFGTLPALALTRRMTRPELAGQRIIAGNGRLQRYVVVAELAGATVLLIAGALLFRTQRALSSIDTGMATQNLLGVSLAPPFERFQNLAPDSVGPAVESYFQRFTDGVATLPGVTGVAVTSILPLTEDRADGVVVPEGWVSRSDDELIAERRFVSVNYFQVAGVRVEDGRPFSSSDDRRTGEKSIIISKGLAERAWPSERAVGRRMFFFGDTCRVVGVVSDVRDEDLRVPTTFAVYAPFRQHGFQVGQLLVRTNEDPMPLINSVRQRIHEIEPLAAIPLIETYKMLADDQTTAERYRARLMSSFALLASLLAEVGVFGVAAGFVSRRTREIGIRISVGAGPRDVLAMVLKQGAQMSATGVALGCVGALGTGRLLEHLLFGVRATDPTSVTCVCVLVLCAGIGATAIPALRAAHLSPAAALRSE